MLVRPNFLIVMSDEHAPQISGPYGHPFVRTPNMQRIANSGVVFQNAYCNSPLCVPSRASFMTGKHLYRTGIWDNGAALASDEPTWAHRLNAVGYDTALAGKMHFVGPDQRHGFQRRLVEDIHGTGTIGGPDWRVAIHEGGSQMRRRIAEAGPGDSVHQQYDDEVTARSVDYMQDPARKKQPWALCASLITPHFPLIVRQPYFDRYFPKHADTPVIPPGHLDAQHPAHQRLRTYFGSDGYTDEQIARARAAYYGLVTFFDKRLGQLLDALEASGQADHTVVMYVSDHGEMYGEHGMWWKCTLYEQSVRIPTIISWPGNCTRGQVLTQVVSLLDCVRTVVELAGAERGELDGDTLTPLLTGDTAVWKDMAFAEYEGHGTVTPARMVRCGRYKLSYYHGEPVELYDLESDPNEFNNLAEQPAYATTREELTALVLRDWNPEEIDRRVRASQQRRKIVAAGERHRPNREWRPQAEPGDGSPAEVRTIATSYP